MQPNKQMSLFDTPHPSRFAEARLNQGEKLSTILQEEINRGKFNGPDYEPENDDMRLMGQMLRVFDCMKDGKYKALYEIAMATGDPQASISAQLRHLRKPRFGGHTVNKKRRGNRKDGLFEYQLIIKKKDDSNPNN